jgi:hypothetical protein
MSGRRPPAPELLALPPDSFPYLRKVRSRRCKEVARLTATTALVVLATDTLALRILRPRTLHLLLSEAGDWIVEQRATGVAYQDNSVT